MYSPDDAFKRMSRDADPDLFQLLLQEEDKDIGDTLFLSDILPLDNESTSNKNPSLRPYIFNLQRHMTERASKSLQNINITFVKDNENPDRTIKYEKKTSFYNNERSDIHILPKKADDTSPATSVNEQTLNSL